MGTSFPAQGTFGGIISQLEERSNGCRDIGVKAGKYYSVNVPLQEGIGDAAYETVFKPVIEKIMDIYRPTGVYTQWLHVF